MITFACPNCRTSVSVDDELAGRDNPCPSCGASTSVPSRGSQGDARSPTPAEVTTDAYERVESDGELKDTDPMDTDAEKELYDFLAPPRETDELGRLGSYRVLRVLGTGGMGVVFEAEDIDLKRRVALKAMLPELTGRQSARRRFLREARLAAAIEHDHIVPIYQVGEDRGVPFLAMQLLRGESLDARLKRQSKLPVADVLRIARETALGLAAAHQQDLVHRDIKPANLWLEAGGDRVKILDFGLARPANDAGLTRSGLVIGTPAFMAPEQAQGQKVDARSDLFSLGSLLYRAATGQAAFRGSDVLAILTAVGKETPTPPCELDPNIPRALSDLIMRLLAKDPEQRPASAKTVAELIPAIEQGATDLAGAENRIETGSRTISYHEVSVSTLPQSRRKRWYVAAVAGAAALVVALIVAWCFSLGQSGAEGDAIAQNKDNADQPIVPPGNDAPPKKDKPNTEPKPEPKPDPEPQPAPPGKKPRLKDQQRYEGASGDDRAVAKWLREQEVSTLQVRIAGTTDLPIVRNEEELPEKPFRIHSIRFDKRETISNELNFATGLTDLQRLHLIKCPIRDQALEDLTDLPKLQELWIIGGEITDDGLVHLKKLKSLKMLLLSDNFLTSKGLAAFKEMPKLDYLGLRGNADISDDGLEELKACSKLTGIDLGETGVTDTGMKVLGTMTNLNTLYLSGTAIGDKGINDLQDNLTMLDLSETRVTDMGFPALGRLTNLGTLKLRKTKIKGAGLTELLALTKLRDIDLHGTEITSVSLAALKEFPSLKLLNLSDSTINDDALRYLRPLTGLQVLSLHNTNISPKGLQELKSSLPKTMVFD